ncbi:hypothetical protein CPB85DRAFT_1256761 [Mucidula mucida]|nr:hypothetical protein CPB85DRAFT_1256761 [Mucidula mucida]
MSLMNLTVTQIPPEIWLDIFEKVSRRPMNSLDTTCAPWTLGQVCTTWRQIVLNNSSLWSTLIVTWEPPRSSEILTEHLRRSAAHPLDVAMKVPTRIDDDAHIVANTIALTSRFSSMDLVTQQSYRWRVIELVAYSDINIADRLKGKLPLLEEFYLKKPFGQGTGLHDQELIRTFLEAPKLRKADFRDSQIMEAPNGAVVPITHLGVTMNSITEIEYLRSYASLVELHLDCYQEPLVSPICITLPTIEMLGVRHSIILDALTLPNLGTLTVRDCTPQSCEILENFLERSRCHLTVLSLLEGELLAKVDLTQPAFRHVIRVTLPIPEMARITMSKLSSPGVLPSLQIVTAMVSDVQFGLEGEHELEATEFIAFLRHRAGLKLLRMYCSDPDFLALQDAGLRELEAAGLAVTLDNFNSNHDEWKWWKGPYWFPVVTVP